MKLSFEYIKRNMRSPRHRPRQKLDAFSVGVRYGPDPEQWIDLKIDTRNQKIYLQSGGESIHLMPHGSTNIELIPQDRNKEEDRYVPDI